MSWARPNSLELVVGAVGEATDSLPSTTLNVTELYRAYVLTRAIYRAVGENALCSNSSSRLGFPFQVPVAYNIVSSQSLRRPWHIYALK